MIAHTRYLALLLALATLLPGLAERAPHDDGAFHAKRFAALFSETERAAPYVAARSHDLHDWPYLDGQWEGILCDSDGNVWFSVSSHAWEHHAQVFRYSAREDKVQHIADLGQVCGEKLSATAPQDKIHSQLFQDGPFIYGGTCEGHHSESLPYKGGYWLRIERATGVITALRKSVSNDGLITVAYDAPRRLLYAHTNVKGQLLRYDPATDTEDVLGVPWHDSPAQWKRDLSLMIAPNGNVYGSKPPNCTFWEYDRTTGKISNLAVAAPLPADVAAGDAKATERYRTTSGRLAMTLWNEQDQCFYAMRSHDETLLRFVPPRDGAPATVTAVARLGLPRHRYGERHASCMMAIIGRTLWYTPYTGWGGVAHLQSCDLDTGAVVDHGPLVVENGRRVAECHSLVAGPEGQLYLVAFVYSIAGVDPVRPNALRDDYPFHPRFVIIAPPVN